MIVSNLLQSLLMKTSSLNPAPKDKDMFLKVCGIQEKKSSDIFVNCML